MRITEKELETTTMAYIGYRIQGIWGCYYDIGLGIRG